MKGYVTWIFAMLLILSGMAMIALSLKFPLQQEILIGMGIQCIGMGGGLIGIGRKVEKAEVSGEKMALATTQEIKEKIEDKAACDPPKDGQGRS